MPKLDLASLAAGLLAYALSVVGAIVLVFVTFRINTRLVRRLEGERMLAAGHRSVAIALGAAILSQALLLRHAVFPAMAVVRDLFLAHASLATVAQVAGQCALFFLIVAVLSVGSVALTGWLFARMTGSLPEHAEILRDNVAVAIFYAFVLLAVTAILNEGVEDLSRSLIPYGASGIVRLP